LAHDRRWDERIARIGEVTIPRAPNEAGVALCIEPPRRLSFDYDGPDWAAWEMIVMLGAIIVAPIVVVIPAPTEVRVLGVPTLIIVVPSTLLPIEVVGRILLAIAALLRIIPIIPVPEATEPSSALVIEASFVVPVALIVIIRSAVPVAADVGALMLRSIGLGRRRFALRCWRRFRDVRLRRRRWGRALSMAFGVVFDWWPFHRSALDRCALDRTTLNRAALDGGPFRGSFAGVTRFRGLSGAWRARRRRFGRFGAAPFLGRWALAGQLEIRIRFDRRLWLRGGGGRSVGGSVRRGILRTAATGCTSAFSHEDGIREGILEGILVYTSATRVAGVRCRERIAVPERSRCFGW